jgi:hypothetical protein
MRSCGLSRSHSPRRDLISAGEPTLFNPSSHGVRRLRWEPYGKLFEVRGNCSEYIRFWYR